MASILPISEVKARFAEIVAAVEKSDEEVVVTRNGRAAAVLLNYDEYESLKATIETLSDPEMMKQIRASRAYFAAGGEGIPMEEVFGEELVRDRPRRRGGK